MRYLLCYSCYENEYSIHDWVNTWVQNLVAAGIDVKSFCLTINPPGPCLLWKELDERWKKRDRELLELYSKLEIALSDRDVLVNWNGINLHPKFVESLKIIKVYGCFDDPESSEVLSRPVAAAYDLCMVGNSAEVETYRQWGVKRAVFWPLGYRHNDYNPRLTKEMILNGSRSNDIMLCCERVSQHRTERLDKFSKEFPQGAYYGRGWPNGFLAESDRVPLMQKTKLGINIHNSTGPINFRTYYLPANGVLQVCDNKEHLGRIFEIGTEAVGYNSIEEAIDLCRYYLEHDEERRAIAAAGFERAVKDYNEVSVFKIMIKEVEKLTKPMQNSAEKLFSKHVTLIHECIKNDDLFLAQQSAEEIVRLAPMDLVTHLSLMDIRMNVGDIDGVRRAYHAIPAELRDTPLFLEKRKEYEDWINSSLKEIWLPNADLMATDKFTKAGPRPTAYSLLIDSYGSEKILSVKADAYLAPGLKTFVMDSLADIGSFYGFKEPYLAVQDLSNQFDTDSMVRRNNELHGMLKANSYSNSNFTLSEVETSKDLEQIYNNSIDAWDRTAPGGLIIWTDFSPIFRPQSEAINLVMLGVTAFMMSKKLEVEVLNLKNSSLGILRKPYE